MTVMDHDTAPPEWTGILREDEDIIWQGAPDQGFRVDAIALLGVMFGAIFAGIAVVFMVDAMQVGGYFWTAGLIHFSVGLTIMAGSLWGDTFKRRHTFYTLTNQNGYVATNFPVLGRKLHTYPIHTDTAVTLIPGDLGSVHFATKDVRTKHGYKTKDIGFDRITNASEIYAMIRDIQKGHHEDTI